MDLKERIKLFSNELKLIKNKDIRKFTCKILVNLPDYFFHIPASSTGKYHPLFTLGECGLTRHVKACVKVAELMFRDECICDFNDLEKDIIISALILHDGVKNGFNKSNYTHPEHPNLICDFIVENEKVSKTIEENILNEIINCVRSHSGPWNKNRSNTKELFPQPSTKMEQFVHLADYLASRRDIEIKI